MKSTTRYSIIATGIVAFILLSPFIYMFIRGQKYDFKNHRVIQTGILSVRTDPKGAKVFLNGEERAKTNTNIRFLNPGDYNVEIKKDGYFTWSKRINIREQYVSWVHLNLPAVTLFYSQPKETSIADNVINFSAGNKRILYLQRNMLLLADIDSPTKTQQLALPREFDNLEITASPNESFYLLQNKDFIGVFDASENKLTDITELVNKQAAFSPTSIFQASQDKLAFSGLNDLFQLKEGTLYKINWREQKKDPVLDKVIAFHANTLGIYYITAETTGLGIQRNLMHAQYPNYQSFPLVENLPSFRTAELYLTNGNQLFILGDGTLYSVGEKLNRFADNVENVKAMDEDNHLLLTTGNEVSVYDPESASTTLVTRSSQGITNPTPVPYIGWVFFQNDNRLQAIETDTRDHQNNYTFATASNNAKNFVDDRAKNIVLLENGKLKQLKIR
jgi:hypothetical protein